MQTELPEGWESAPLERLVRLKRGYDLPVSQRAEGKVPVVAANGPVGTHNIAAAQGPVVVTGRSGTIGKVALYEHECHPLNTTLYSEKTHGNNVIYIYYFLTWFRLEQFATGTGVPTLNRNDVHAREIIIPPLPEQRRIAEILTAVDDSIRAGERVIEQAERVKKGLMEELLTGGLGSAAIERGEVPEGWAARTFEDELSFRGGGQPPKSTFVYQPQDGYVRLLQIRDFDSDGKPAFIPSTATRNRCKQDDVLIARYGASLGRILRGKAGAYNVALVKIICSTGIDKGFAYWWLNGATFQNRLAAIGSRSAQAGFNKTDLAPIPLALPSLAEQGRIAAILTSIDQQIDASRKHVEQQKRLKRGLMDDLLTGRVRTV